MIVSRHKLLFQMTQKFKDFFKTYRAQNGAIFKKDQPKKKIQFIEPQRLNSSQLDSLKNKLLRQLNQDNFNKLRKTIDCLGSSIKRQRYIKRNISILIWWVTKWSFAELMRESFLIPPFFWLQKLIESKNDQKISVDFQLPSFSYFGYSRRLNRFGNIGWFSSNFYSSPNLAGSIYVSSGVFYESYYSLSYHILLGVADGSISMN